MDSKYVLTPCSSILNVEFSNSSFPIFLSAEQGIQRLRGVNSYTIISSGGADETLCDTLFALLDAFLPKFL
jgi:hypothetical protein